MFLAGLKLAVLALLPVLARADPNPTGPSGTDIFKVGGQCPIQWTIDPTGTWTAMTIQFMTGENFAMVPLTTVAVVDATKTSSYTWTCPDVTPCSTIYFYQFSSPTNATDLLWTTRFTIQCKDGSTTPPTNPLESDGSAIPWGTGHINANTTVPASSAPATTAPGTIAPVATLSAPAGSTPPPASGPPSGGSPALGGSPAANATVTPSAAGASGPGASSQPNAAFASASNAKSIAWGALLFGAAAVAL